MSSSIRLKRQVTVKTIVTEAFKQRAHVELSDELAMIDQQLQQLEGQYQHSLQQLEQFAAQGQNVARQMEQLNMEVQQERHKLSSLKLDVSSKLGGLEKIELGSLMVTGVLESDVDVSVGDNLYTAMRSAEIVIKDGVIELIQSS